MLLRSVYQVVFLNILVESYCVSAQPQPKEDYLELATIIKEALDEDNSSEQVATDYADFVRLSDLIENKEIEPIDPRTVVSTADDDGSDCKAELVATNLDVSAIISAKNALEVACGLSKEPKTRCIFFINVYKQTYRKYDYACFYNSKNNYINPKAKFVEFSLGIDRYFLFNQRRY